MDGYKQVGSLLAWGNLKLPRISGVSAEHKYLLETGASKRPEP